jgi:hypothetical protein
MLMFDANGHFSAALIRAGIPKIASNNRLQGTPEEYKAIENGTLTFFGTYSVAGSEEAPTLTGTNPARRGRMFLSSGTNSSIPNLLRQPVDRQPS